MKYLYKHTPELVVVIYLFIFMGFKSPERNWDRIINSDGKGYYAYLPAIFLYDDLQFNFIDQYEYQYYPANKSVYKEFRNEVDGRKVNKYFPGLAILWLPFFLLGHAFAWLEIFPRDGYSLPYQYAIACSAFFFLWLGARWLMKTLSNFGSSEKNASFITVVIALGTNLVFFTIIEPSMTHVYSFALITGFVYFVHKTINDYHSRWFVKSLLLLTLIFLIRPTNLLVVILVPFIAGNREALFETFKKIKADRTGMIRGGIQALILLMIPLTLWFIQTGKPIVYSYGSEKLSLLQPNFFDILFSYNRGWLLYTPVAFVSLFGFVGLFRMYRTRFYWLAGFLLSFIYIVSCWWVWYYASKCGQRIFIDIYVVVALLLLFLYQSIDRRYLKRMLTGLIVALMVFNLVQFYQHAKWIFPPYNITSEIYWDSFFSFTNNARVYIPGEGVRANKRFSNDMEQEYGASWMNPRTRNDTVFYSGKWSSKSNRMIPYTIGLETRIDTLFTTKNRLIRIDAITFSPKEVPDATLVVDYQLNGKSLSYNQFILEKYVRPNQWTPVSVAFYVPANFPDQGTVKVYFYNPSPLYNFYIDDLNIDFISLKEEADYRKIEGVLLPEAIKDF